LRFYFNSPSLSLKKLEVIKVKMNRKIVAGAVYLSIFAGIWVRNYLTTPMELISEKYNRIEHEKGVVYVIDGQYKNAFGWNLKGKRIEAVTNDGRVLSDRFTRNSLEESIQTKIAKKYLDIQTEISPKTTQ
jgi:hypothetical protein